MVKVTALATQLLYSGILPLLCVSGIGAVHVNNSSQKVVVMSMLA